MYRVDRKDRVSPLEGVPQPSPGAPVPVVLADEHSLWLAYYVEGRDPDWDGTTPRAVGLDSEGETVAIVEFERARASMFGPPNDEAFKGHPLASRGLRPYRAQVVERSSWIRILEKMNSVHPYHDKKLFDALNHYVFAFHDATFECVAAGFEVACIQGSMLSAIDWMRERLGERSS